ncbi:hypothetical protein TSUD_155780 [Trifolium subterraneum]|uniref:Retrotransposon gag domain-containing protein n=1 Tax=Trifolium subterraneum TaxID=3900 RepID=A0A2Z6N165_TRISU|nr:hypothetical protein TSUD_155780 [Trifolium subterraneum]
MQLTIANLAEQMKNQGLTFAELSKQFQQMGKRVLVDSSMESEGSVGNETQTESRLSGKKVKLPVFDGEDPVAWITRAEIYFDVQNTMEEMKVKLSRLSMEGPTIHWFNLLLEAEDNLSWVKLKKALIARYGGRRLENPFEELSTLKQTGSVEDYVESFELLSSQVGRLPEEQYLGYFMGGLIEPIRRRVRTFNPTTRMEVMRIAKDVESELKNDDDEGDRRHNRSRSGRGDWYGSKSRNGPNLAQLGSQPNSQAGWNNPNRKPGSNNSNSNSSSSVASTGRKSESDGRSGAWKGIRSLHNDEIIERRAKGLCFKCGGKYHPVGVRPKSQSI